MQIRTFGRFNYNGAVQSKSTFKFPISFWFMAHMDDEAQPHNDERRATCIHHDALVTPLQEQTIIHGCQRRRDSESRSPGEVWTLWRWGRLGGASGPAQSDPI